MVFAALKFTVALLILKWMPLRLALTPAATKLVESVVALSWFSRLPRSAAPSDARAC